MKAIYVAGPFRAANQWDQHQNIRRAEALALEVWKLGAVAICPHTNTMHYQGVLPDRVWLEGDLELVRRCDAVVLTMDWHQSEGASKEAAYASRLGKPVFSDIESLRQWLRTPVPQECRGECFPWHAEGMR